MHCHSWYNLNRDGRTKSHPGLVWFFIAAAATLTLIMASIRSHAQSKSSLVAVVMVGSAAVLVQASVDCGGETVISCSNLRAYAVAAGAIGFVASLVYMLAITKGSVLFTGTMEMALAGFLFLWWIVGCGILTFNQPFSGTGNGYFGAWAAFIASTALLGLVWSDFKSQTSRIGSGPMTILMFASIILMFQAASDCSNGCDGTLGYAVAVGPVSLVLVLLLFFAPVDAYRTFIVLFLLIWWIAAAAVLTFGAPYEGTGNGYFSCWAGVLGSVMLFFASGGSFGLPETTNSSNKANGNESNNGGTSKA